MKLMEQRINDGLSPYRIFTRAEWAARREDTPMTLTPAEIADLKAFNDQYARGIVTGRTVVVILSDGYDTDPAERLGLELARLKRRRCKIVWLNPLKGWKGYEPVARGMAAALPHLDLFAAANTLEKLEALEPHLRKV